MRRFKLLTLRQNYSPYEMVNILTELSRNGNTSFFVKNNNSFMNIISELNRGLYDPSEIIHLWLKEKDLCPPLELLWTLDKENILRITTFLYFHQDYCLHVNYLLSNKLSGETEESEQFPIEDVLCEILGKILNIRKNEDFKFLSEDVIHNFIKEVVTVLDNNQLQWNYFRKLRELNIVNISALKEFAFLHLEKLLHLESICYSLSFVISHQKQWTSEKLDQGTTTLIKELISILDSQTIIGEIDAVVHQETFNWKYLLVIISIFVENVRNSESLKGKVDRWFSSALENKDKKLLYTCLAVARQCCAEKARYFSNYPTWFGSLSLKSAPNFTFFFECLSHIVPDESPLYLKIHVNKVPSAPTSCQGIIVDYLTLAKTRLADLNETTDYIGLFNDYHETDEEGQESDVQRAIYLFHENKEIPKPLLEAHVFRRQYYEKVFLKRLLSLTKNEDPRRAELIKKLHSSGKIPSALYRSWSSRCLNS